MSIDPLNNNVPPDYFFSPLFQELDPSIQTDLIQNFSEAELNNLFPVTGDFAPILTPPDDAKDTSILGFFGTLQDAALALRSQLFKARETDLANKARLEALASATAALAETYDKSNTSGKNVGNEVKDTMTEASTEVDNQNAAITSINSGAATEKSRATQQIQDYNTFVNTLTSMGAVYQGQNANGDDVYVIPAPSPNTQATRDARTAAYNSAASTYFTNTANYNNYWSSRSQTILDYNTTTTTYNANATTNTNYLQSVLDDYNLADNVQKEGYTSAFTQPTAGFRNDGGTLFLSSRFTSPSSLSNPTYPVTIAAERPSDWVYTKSNATVSSLQVSSISYPNLTDSDLNKIKDIVAKGVSLYLIGLNSPLDLTYVAYMRNLIATGVFDRAEDGDTSVLEGLQLPRKRVFPTSHVGVVQTAATTTTGASGLNALTLASSDHMLSLMGKALVEMVTRDLNVDEEQKKNISNQALILAFNFIQANTSQSLLSGLSPIADYLASLPPNSPVFNLLFSLSLGNQLQEAVQQGKLSEALQTLIESNPALGNLTPDQLNNLISALQAGVLLVAAELIFTNLGLPEALPPLLADTLVPNPTPAEVDALVHDAIIQRKNELANLRIELENNFKAKQLTKEEITFLAIQDATARSLALTPTPSAISPQTVDQDILADSIQAGLIQLGVPLAQAVIVAKQAIQEAFIDNELLSLDEFGKNIERNLRQADIDRKDARSVVEQAVIVAPKPAELSDLQGILTELRNQAEAAVSSQLFVAIARTATNLLASPQDAKVVKILTEQLAITLFGTANPDPADIAKVKSPLSLISQIKDQIRNLKIEDNKERSDALASVFKETIKPSVELNVFLQKIMDPAYYFLYVLSQSSLMNAKGNTPTVLV